MSLCLLWSCTSIIALPTTIGVLEISVSPISSADFRFSLSTRIPSSDPLLLRMSSFCSLPFSWSFNSHEFDSLHTSEFGLLLRNSVDWILFGFDWTHWLKQPYSSAGWRNWELWSGTGLFISIKDGDFSHVSGCTLESFIFLQICWVWFWLGSALSSSLDLVCLLFFPFLRASICKVFNIWTPNHVRCCTMFRTS